MRYRVFLVILILIAGQFLVLGNILGREDLPREKTVFGDVATYEQIVLIPPGEDFVITFDPESGRLNPREGPELEEPCRNALELVPEWMRINLTHKFRLLSSTDRIMFSNIILNSPDEKFIDEIGFVIAHSTPQTLIDDNFFPQLVTHNAELIYEYDKYLDYVEIVEKDDYTTLAYRQADNSTVEISREDYYWYVVHPKLGDELPTYVDPDYDYTSEPPFDRSKGTAPPAGKYWRDWFFVYNKTGQPLLKDILSGKNTTLDAIKAINGWISKSMTFTSDNERPVQPVRIYVKGQGRCGEYQDMRAAAARAGLIPVIATSNPAEDHVWNEFLDLEWYHWDGMIDNPHAYEKGWGKTISSVWNSRGDGYTWSVTSRYSDVSTINAKVVDLNNLPVDGAEIAVYTENFYQPEIKTVTYSDVTDSSGGVSFELGDERNYWGKADTTDLGSDPANPVTQEEIALNTSAGEEYDILFKLPQAAPKVQVFQIQRGPVPIPPPFEPGDPEYGMEFEVIGQITRGNARVASGRFDLYQEGGNIDFFLADSPNMAFYQTGVPAGGYFVNERISNLSVSPQVASDTMWSYVLSNGFSQQTYKVIKVKVIVKDVATIKIDKPVDGQEVSSGEFFEISGVVFADGSPEVEISIGSHENRTWRPATMEPGENGSVKWGAFISFHFPHHEVLPLEHQISARIRGNNESMIGTYIVLVDTTPPNIRAQLEPSRVKEGEFLTLTGGVDDHVSIKSIEYSIDTSRDRSYIETDEGRSAEFSLDISTSSMDHGTHQLHIFAEDHFENIAEMTLDFEVVERISPELEIYTPSEDAILKYGDPITIEGKARDNVGLSEVTVSLQDPRSTMIVDIDDIDEKGKFTIEFDYTSSHAKTGMNSIILFAKDEADNDMTVSSRIYFDGERPSISLDHSRRMIVPGNSEVDISGVVSDDHDLDTLEMKINDGPYVNARYSSSTGSFSFGLDTSFDLSEGDNVVTLKVMDGVGWDTEEEIVITVDSEAPEIEFDTDIEYVMKGAKMDIRVTLEETYEIEDVQLLISGGGSSDVTDQLDVAEIMLEIDSSELRAGSVTLTIQAMDEAGNIGEATHSIHVITDTLDTDEDGIPDWWEYQHSMNPFEFDSDQDPDGDKYTNLQEFLGDDGEWGNEDDSTDPRSSQSKPVKSSSSGPNIIFFVILGIVIAFIVLIAVGLLFTRRKF